MTTHFQKCVREHRPVRYTTERIVFSTEKAAKEFLKDFTTSYKKPLTVKVSRRFVTITRNNKNKE